MTAEVFEVPNRNNASFTGKTNMSSVNSKQVTNNAHKIRISHEVTS